MFEYTWWTLTLCVECYLIWRHSSWSWWVTIRSPDLCMTYNNLSNFSGLAATSPAICGRQQSHLLHHLQCDGGRSLHRVSTMSCPSLWWLTGQVPVRGVGAVVAVGALVTWFQLASQTVPEFHGKLLRSPQLPLSAMASDFRCSSSKCHSNHTFLNWVECNYDRRVLPCRIHISNNRFLSQCSCST